MGLKAPTRERKTRGEISVLFTFLLLLSLFLGYFFIAYKTDEEALIGCTEVARKEGGRLTGIIRGIFTIECEWSK